MFSSKNKTLSNVHCFFKMSFSVHFEMSFVLTKIGFHDLHEHHDFGFRYGGQRQVRHQAKTPPSPPPGSSESWFSSFSGQVFGFLNTCYITKFEMHFLIKFGGFFSLLGNVKARPSTFLCKCQDNLKISVKWAGRAWQNLCLPLGQNW